MTGSPTKPTPSAPASGGPGAQLLVDVGPLVLWLIVYFVAGRTRPDEALFIATGVYIPATLAALAYARIKQKRWPLMLVVTAVIVTLFGAAGILLKSQQLLYMKPTIIYTLFAVAIFGSLAVGQNALKLLLTMAFELPDRVWRILALRWGLWFVVMAVLNEVVWRNFPEPFWVKFKVFGVLPLTFLFAMANMPLILKHAPEEGGEGRPGAAE